MLKILVMQFGCTGLPLLAIILSLVRETRSFGLGMLLACALGWLILLSTWGGFGPSMDSNEDYNPVFTPAPP